jgi:adenine deaminase
VDFFVMLPSCVPATDLETSGACLKAADLLTLKNEPRVLGLAEMMNYPGVIAGDPEVLDKVAAFRDRPLDGHAPLLTGRDLNAYIAAGLRSDHECTSLDEAREKLRLGMHLFIREGTQAKNLEALLPLVTPATLHRCSFVTDDLHPHDILRHGHLDAVLNQAIGRGLDPLDAIAMVTLNTARYFGLRDRGAVAPGYRADLVLLSSLSPIRVEVVYKNGRRVYEGSYPVLPPQGNIPTFHLPTKTVRPYDRLALAIPARGCRVRDKDLIPEQILTGMTLLDAPVAEGRIVQDTDRDLLKIAVIERHRRTGRIGLGLVRGFSLQRGALASSVAHDSHNILCVGADDGDMVAAARAVEVMGGGLAVACDGEVLARLALPIGGLMSDNSLEEIASGWESLRFTAQQLGCTLHEPFMHLSFLALPVIPALKITDRGLVDVGRFEIVPLCVEERG